MSDRRVSKEELEAFWRGDKNTYQRMYSQRMQKKADKAEKQGKQVTYVPNDGSATLPEVLVTAPRETEEQKNLRLKQDYEDFTGNAITAAGFIPGLDIAADIADIGNSWRKGDRAGVLWGVAGLGLPISGKIARASLDKLRSPLKTFYTELYPSFYKLYKDLKLGGLENDLKAFFRTDITENPFKAVGRNRLYRRRWNHPKPTVEDVTLDPSIVTNSQKDALELTKTRWFNGGQNKIESNKYDGLVFTLNTPQEDWDKFEVLDYIPINKVWKETRGIPMLERPFITARLYNKLNSSPGVAWNGRSDIIVTNNKLLNLMYPRWKKNTILGHEVDHILNYSFPHLPKGFDYSHLPKRKRNYLNKPQEVSARGNQLKNYFGFTSPDQIITPDMLKYAAKHYVEDTGMDNNMLQFFSGIKDWSAAADWLSKYSLKKGGKL